MDNQFALTTAEYYITFYQMLIDRSAKKGSCYTESSIIPRPFAFSVKKIIKEYFKNKGVRVSFHWFLEIVIIKWG